MRDGRKGAGFGVFLLIIGIVWLLSYYNVVTIKTLYALLELWPLILIAAGIGVFFKDKAFIRAAAWLTLLAVVICYGYFGNPKQVLSIGIFTNDTASGTKQPYKDGDRLSFDRTPGVERGELRLSYGAAQLNVDSSAAELLEAETDLALVDYTQSLKNNGNKSSFDFRMKNVRFGNAKDTINSINRFHLSNGVIWEMYVDTGASKSNLNLSGLKVETLKVNTGASEISIDAGSYDTQIDIKAGASKIDITLPEDTGMKIKLEGGLNSTNFDEAAWTKDGAWYYSPGYNEKKYKAAAQISMGLGNLTVR